MTSDAFHITGADPEGQARAMRRALADAGLPPQAVDVAHAHATSTPSATSTKPARSPTRSACTRRRPRPSR
ncbi:hypothetical protein ACU686_40680 [Yinghuangia aomiensis]